MLHQLPSLLHYITFDCTYGYSQIWDGDKNCLSPCRKLLNALKTREEHKESNTIVGYTYQKSSCGRRREVTNNTTRVVENSPNLTLMCHISIGHVRATLMEVKEKMSTRMKRNQNLDQVRLPINSYGSQSHGTLACDFMIFTTSRIAYLVSNEGMFVCFLLIECLYFVLL